MSTIIKSGGSLRGPQQVAFNLEDVTQQATKYLDKIRAQAAQIIADAQRQADAIRRQAEEEGRQAAMRAAEKVLDDKVGKRMQTLLPALQTVVNNIADAKQAWLGQWERSTVRLAAAIAGKVVRGKTPDLPEVTSKLVREALEMAAGSSQVRILLNPDDHETLQPNIARLTKELGRIGGAEILADSQITAGGCRVETLHGSIDQQFEAQLSRIEQELTRANDA
ncbi:MAG TPA: FliH/SctL family protein [Pirellulales bacterium]|jgi:flagellar biosynthesis/type III secretory pathway protein FliH|nr:FliH/SctL family protein [Pirellulales bacterium]